MKETLIPYAIAWGALAVFILGLAIYRRVIADREDDLLHVRDDEAQLIGQQGVVAHKLQVIDKWGKILTTVAFVAGMVIAGFFVYGSWVERNVESQTIPILR